jgi:hypothetical protein
MALHTASNMSVCRRLAMALHTAGLAGTQAARDAMMTVKGTLLPRKDMFTSAQVDPNCSSRVQVGRVGHVGPQ